MEFEQIGLMTQNSPQDYQVGGGANEAISAHSEV